MILSSLTHLSLFHISQQMSVNKAHDPDTWLQVPVLLLYAYSTVTEDMVLDFSEF